MAEEIECPECGGYAGLFIGKASAEPMTLVAARCKMIAMFATGRE